MDRALVGGSQKRFALGVVEVTVERYASLEAVDECAGRTITHTVAACLGMGFGVSHFDRDPIEGNRLGSPGMESRC